MTQDTRSYNRRGRDLVLCHWQPAGGSILDPTLSSGGGGKGTPTCLFLSVVGVLLPSSPPDPGTLLTAMDRCSPGDGSWWATPTTFGHRNHQPGPSICRDLWSPMASSDPGSAFDADVITPASTSWSWRPGQALGSPLSHCRYFLVPAAVSKRERTIRPGCGWES